MSGRVLWVADGDTVLVRLRTRTELIRYIGVNSPEIPHPTKRAVDGGQKARAVNRLLVGGRTVRIERDVQPRDRYGRLLAYVWTKRGRRPVMVNAEMVRLGYARVMTIPPNTKYRALFLKLQREAREAGRGLWGRG